MNFTHSLFTSVREKLLVTEKLCEKAIQVIQRLKYTVHWWTKYIQNLNDSKAIYLFFKSRERAVLIWLEVFHIFTPIKEKLLLLASSV